VANPGQDDCDANGVGEACEPGDADSDGVSNDADNAPCVANAGQEDGDGDGIGDSSDLCPDHALPTLDTDGDGVGDRCDPCPLLAGDAADADLDGFGNACDDCPMAPDPAQRDDDADGVGDACVACPEPSALDADPTAAPLRIERGLAFGELTASWQDTGAASYDLLRGTLASLHAGAYDHAPFGRCGLTSTVGVLVPWGNGDFYYLVQSRCGTSRSSLGTDSRGTPRPPALSACP
jgi:hypothetical protein